MTEVLVGGTIALIGSIVGAAYATRASQKRVSREHLHLVSVPNLRVANAHFWKHLEEARRHAVIAGKAYPPLVGAIEQDTKHPALDALEARLEKDLGRRWF